MHSEKLFLRGWGGGESHYFCTHTQIYFYWVLLHSEIKSSQPQQTHFKKTKLVAILWDFG